MANLIRVFWPRPFYTQGYSLVGGILRSHVTGDVTSVMILNALPNFH